MEKSPWEVFCLLIVVLANLLCHGEARAKRRLDSFIEHFETLDYDPSRVEIEHNRVRRETPYFGRFEGDPLSMHFRAHGRSFDLQLVPDHQVVRPDTQFLGGDGKPFPFDASELVHGQLADEPGSVVSGTVVKGVFHGVIHTPSERYHVDPARRYFANPSSFHSVIYRTSDVSFNDTACGVSAKIHKWMKEMQASGEDLGKSAHTDNDGHHRYMRSANRERRQSTVNLENVECRIKIAGDYKFSEQVALEEGLSISGDPINARAAAARVLASYVLAVNKIYIATRFGITTGRAEMIQFAIKTSQIYLTKAETEKVNTALGEPLIGVDRFLDLWSRQNLNDFCLAYLFTYRDFNNGVLGLAWVGSSGSAAGGVCDKYQRYSDGNQKTLNTGIVTFLNYGRRVASEVSHLTFAHELGHNLGSNHDPTGDSRGCTPGSPDGNYIMYAHATSGNNPNNNKFSPCSVQAIAQILRAKALTSTGCFDQVSNGSICGNGVRDGNEECDCGTSEMCRTSACCNSNCTLKWGKQCSPQQGPCCNASCTFLSPVDRPVCSEINECRQGNGTCNGTSAQCQLAPPKPDGVLCASNSSTCSSGSCTGSLCRYIGQVPCFCTGNDGCDVCCAVNSSSTCSPIRTRLSGINTKLPPGSPCDNYLGFCDFLHFCRRLDDQGPIARLKDALFSSDSIDSAYEWSKKHWYVVLAGVIGIVIIMALIVKFCSVHTESTVDTMKRKRQGGGGGGGGGGARGGARERRGKQEHQMNNMR